MDQAIEQVEVQNEFWDKKTLFIRHQYGGTYKVISDGIIEGLRNLVREIFIADVNQDVANLVDQMKPDLVLVLLGDAFPVSQVDAIRKMGIKTAVWFTDDPYYTDVTTTIAPYYDYVFTQELSCVSYYQSLGISHVHYLPLAVNTKFFHKQSEDNSFLIDICFIGTAWNDRIFLFDQISHYLRKKNVVIVGDFWNKMQNYHILFDKIRLGVLSPEESAYLINKSKIVINNHRSFDDKTVFNTNSNKLPALSINPRTFEISACGAFQLSDVRQELQRYYEPGKEIETYTSPSDLIEKMEYYLLDIHEDERNAIAQEGHIQTLKNHTYPKRLVTMLKIIFG